MSGPVVDLFAGPGGWDLAAHHLGLRPLGIEWDPAACATRDAAGLWTLQADVSALDPFDTLLEAFGVGIPRLHGLIASPPCQAFSMAGKGHGRAAIDVYAEAIRRMSVHALDGSLHPMTTEELDEASGDPRGHLVLEPLRWALALKPRWIACEQVEPVLPLWEAMGQALRQHGYHTDTGVLSAERYGVPQTRRRAILLASLDGPVELPAPTHARFVAPRNRDDEGGGLFDLPEPERITLPEDAHLAPWVSMAEALGWSGGHVGFPRRADTPDRVAVAGVDYRARDLRHTVQPAFALTEKARSWVRFQVSDMPNAAIRGLDEPAPTMAFGHNSARAGWTLRTGNFTAIARDADGGRSAAGSVPYARPVIEPAPTVRAAGAGVWTTERPATTLRASDEVHASTYTDRDPSWTPGDPEPSQATGAVRVSLAEALVLQSFPPDYPVQGTKTKQFEQVGNAVPPLLAWHVLRQVANTDPQSAHPGGHTVAGHA